MSDGQTGQAPISPAHRHPNAPPISEPSMLNLHCWLITPQKQTPQPITIAGFMVPETGVEPARPLRSLGPEPSASASSATRAGWSARRGGQRGGLDHGMVAPSARAYPWDFPRRLNKAPSASNPTLVMMPGIRVAAPCVPYPGQGRCYSVRYFQASRRMPTVLAILTHPPHLPGPRWSPCSARTG